MLLIEVVIDLHIDLIAVVRLDNSTVAASRTADSSPRPTNHASVQTIAAVECIGERHRSNDFRDIAARIHDSTHRIAGIERITEYAKTLHCSGRAHLYLTEGISQSI